jgi:hypothetical protein
MTYFTISYGINTLSSMTSTSDYILVNNNYVITGTSIVDTSFNLQLNYSNLPSGTTPLYNLIANYSITAIRIE